MSFYNPYSKYPDVGQGVSDLVMQFIQMMMMNKYMGGGEGKKAGAGKGNGAPTSVGAGMADQAAQFNQRHPFGYNPPINPIPDRLQASPLPQGLDINLLIELLKNAPNRTTF